MADSGEQDNDRSRGRRRSRQPPAAGEEAHGRSSRLLGTGQLRRLLHRPPSPRVSPYENPGVRNRLEMPTGGERETKLYLSNLANSVSDYDIKLLFSYIAEVKDYGVHYDRLGRPRGTGEVVFFCHSHAMEAIRRYQYAPLDGRLLNIQEVGVHFEIPAVLGQHLRGPRPIGPSQFVSAAPHMGGNGRYEQGESSIRFPMGGHGGHDIRPQMPSGHEFRRERSHQIPTSAAQLDAELDRYHFDAKKQD